MVSLNKNIVYRSKVHLCTAVVWKRRHIFEKQKVGPVNYYQSSLLYCSYFKGPFCKVSNAGAIPLMLAYKQKHLPIIKDPPVIPSFIHKELAHAKLLVVKRPSYLSSDHDINEYNTTMHYGNQGCREQKKDGHKNEKKNLVYLKSYIKGIHKYTQFCFIVP